MTSATVSGVEEFVRRAERKTWDRPLALSLDATGCPKVGRDGCTCAICGKRNAGIHYAPHRSNRAYYIVKFHCHCGAKLWEVAEALGMTMLDVEHGNNGLLAKYAEPLPPPDIDPADVDRYVEQLWSDERLVRYVERHRLVSRAVMRRRKIGHDGERFIIPVSEDGRYVNLRRYLPDAPPGVPKILSLPNSGAQIVPGVPDAKYLIKTEGEWDAFAVESLGSAFASFTTTGGAMCWRDRWSHRFRHKSVFIIGDRDDAGVAGAEKVARSLQAVGCEVFVIELPLRYSKTHGPDVTDFLRGGGNLRQLLNDTWQRARTHESAGGGRHPRSHPSLSRVTPSHRDRGGS
ncbi:MAG: toprim domain-containing protein [Ilumatobacteraceae bacterium]